MRYRLGWILLCLPILLTGCGSSQVAVQTKTIRLLPPAELMEPVPIPEFTATTNGELADAYLDVVDALKRANAQFEALKTWADGSGERGEKGNE